MKKILEFKCSPTKGLYVTDSFKIYACKVDYLAYPDVKVNNYGNVSIVGDMQNLTMDIEYKVKAEESDGKYGVQYKVISITREKPTDIYSSRVFLSEILTENQASVLLEAYPNIIDKVIKNDLSDIDLNKTHGIKEKTFEKVKDKIIENFSLMELVSKFKGYITLNMLRSLMVAYKSAENVVEKLESKPYKSLCRLSRVGFLTADKILLKLEEEGIINFDDNLLESKDRMRACIIYNLEENESDGNTKISRDSLRRKCNNLAGEAIGFFGDILKDEDDKEIYYDKDSKSVAMKRTYLKEVYIADKIKQGISVDNKWDVDYELYRYDENGLELTDQQMSALINICSKNVAILDGKAGSGKTHTVATISKMLKDNRKSLSMAAPTGRAAKIIATYSGLNASTIHRLIGFRPPAGCEHNENNPLTDDVIIIDETSMADVDLMYNLLSAINFNKTKLLLVGDSDQLPSVGAGNVLHDLINSGKVPLSRLDKIFRFGKGGVDTVSTHIREMKYYLEDGKAMQIFGEKKDYVFLQSGKSSILANIDKIYEKLMFEKGLKSDEIMVLSSYNKGEFGTVALNNRLQTIANPLAGLDGGVKVGETTYYKNDMVIQVRNNYEAIIYDETYEDVFQVEPNKTFIPNGEIGKIIDVGAKNVIIQFEKHKVIYKRDEIINNFKLAYSISIHKSQGSSSDYTIVVTPSSHSFFLNSNLLYVAVTRTKKTCYHIGDMGTVASAIKKKANFNRKTFLKDLILDVDKDKKVL